MCFARSRQRCVLLQSSRCLRALAQWTLQASTGPSLAARPAPERGPWIRHGSRRSSSNAGRRHVAPWIKQLGKLPSDSGAELVVIDPDGKPSGNAEDWNVWPIHLVHLKVPNCPLWIVTRSTRGGMRPILAASRPSWGSLRPDWSLKSAGVELKLRGEFKAPNAACS